LPYRAASSRAAIPMKDAFRKARSSGGRRRRGGPALRRGSSTLGLGLSGSWARACSAPPSQDPRRCCTSNEIRKRLGVAGRRPPDLQVAANNTSLFDQKAEGSRKLQNHTDAGTPYSNEHLLPLYRAIVAVCSCRCSISDYRRV
jgi:hypothetical protein